MTDTLTLCAQLAAWHRDRGDEWAAGHIDRMNHAEKIRLARSIRANQPERSCGQRPHAVASYAPGYPQAIDATLEHEITERRKVA